MVKPERKIYTMDVVGQAVGQGVLVQLYMLHGAVHEVMPISYATSLNYASASNVRLLADCGEIIATKHLNRWLVERSLSRVRRLPLRQHY